MTGDMDGDGRGEVICRVGSGSFRWVEVLSGGTGRPIWQRGLEAGWFSAPSWTPREVRDPPHVVSVRGEQRIAACAGAVVLELSAVDGRILSRGDTGQVVERSPVVADLDGDGSADLLMLGERGAGRHALMGWSVAQGGVVWREAVRGALASSSGSDIERGEVSGRRRWNGVQVRRGDTGGVLWERKLALAPSFSMVPMADQMVTGPDVDGDGWDEVFVASMVRYALAPGEGFQYVDGLSGRTGERLWWRQVGVVQDGNDKFGPLGWWRRSSADWPLLLVPMLHWPERAKEVWMLDPANGRVEARLGEAFQLQSADLDGDGLDDLAFRTTDLSTVEFGAGRQHALRGEPPLRWHRLRPYQGEGKAVRDVDGDGVQDLLLVNPLELVSGRTGGRLWRGAHQPSAVEPLAGAAGDLDGDGWEDLLGVQVGTASGGGYRLRPVQALSLRTGRQIWSGDLESRMVGGLHLAGTIESPVEGRQGVVLSIVADLEGELDKSEEPAQRLWLLVMEAGDGSVRWRKHLSGVTESVQTGWRFAPAFGDLAGDGWEDVVVGAMPADLRWSVRGYSGRDGAVLWEWQ